jgi:hypothetical protein
MPVETMTSTAWPSLNESHGNNELTAEAANNNEWEMIAEIEGDTINGNNRHVVILPTDENFSTAKESKGRPRSATVGGEGAAIAAVSNRVLKECGSFGDSVSKGGDVIKFNRRSLRRCASTPDLLVSDQDHEVIVEDESDEDEDGEEILSSDEGDLCEEDESMEDNTDEEDKTRDGDESFEVLSEKNSRTDEPVMVDADVSIDASAWTLPSAATAPTPVTTSAWGSKSAPSFADILAKNADKPMSWGCDKQKTEAMLRDSHRRHHLRVRTKPKFIVADEASGLGKMMKHAHSTGDLTKMMEMVEQERQRAGKGRMKKQFSALMEEDDEGDFVIGRGSGGGMGGGGGDMNTSEVLGDTDAMDYYHRKDKGSQSTVNKKKERPDEAKRKEISMYKKELQREKQQSRSKGGGNANAESDGKKKKNEKGFGGKKERRRL